MFFFLFFFWCQGIKTAWWPLSSKSGLFIFVQQRSHPDHRANQNDDFRHHTKPELWFPEHKPATGPHPWGVRHTWVNIHLQPYVVPHPVFESLYELCFAAPLCPNAHGQQRREEPQQPPSFKTHTDQQTVAEIVCGRPKHVRRRGQHEVYSRPPELGGGNAG